MIVPWKSDEETPPQYIIRSVGFGLWVWDGYSALKIETHLLVNGTWEAFAPHTPAMFRKFYSTNAPTEQEAVVDLVNEIYYAEVAKKGS